MIKNLLMVSLALLSIQLGGYKNSHASQFEITQLTNNSYNDVYPSIHNDNIAWIANDGYIHFWDGSSIINVGEGSSPSLYDGTIAYYKTYNGGSVFYWDGNSSTYIAQGSHASLYDGKIAYVVHTGINNGDIYYWDGVSSTYVGSGHNPSLYDGTIAWQWYDGHDSEILYWDGSKTTQITNNDYIDEDVSLYNGTMAWSGNVNNQSREFYTGMVTTRPKLQRGFHLMDILPFGKERSLGDQL